MTSTDRARANGKEPGVQEGNRECQTRETRCMTQPSGLQIKAMFLEIAEHLFDPHPSAVIAQSQGGVGQIAG